MKVLHVVQRYSPAIGGAEEYITGLSEELVRRGHTVDVYTSRALDYQSWRDELPPYEERNGVSVHRFKSIRRGEYTWSILNAALRSYWPQRQQRYEPLIYAGNGPVCLGMWIALWRNIRQYDLVHIINLHYAHAWPAYWYAQQQNVPIIVSPLTHAEQPVTYDVQYIRNIFSSCHAVLSLTVAEKQFLANFVPDETPIVASGVGLSIDPDMGSEDYSEPDRSSDSSASSPPNVPESTTSSGCDLSAIPAYRHFFKQDTDDRFVMLFLARKVDYKGLRKCVDAWMILRQQGYNVWLFALGPETEDSEQLWRQYALSHDSSHDLSRVYNEGLVIRGMVSDEERAAALALCNVFVLPSTGESFGIVYLEAWAYGKPVIGANIAAVSSLIQNGYDGILIDVDKDDASQVTELCSAVRHFIQNPLSADRMGTHGYQKLQEQYTAEKIGEVVEETYAHILYQTPLPKRPDREISIAPVEHIINNSIDKECPMPQNMSDIPDDLLEIRDPALNSEEVMEKIRQRIEQRRNDLGYEEREFPRFGVASYSNNPDDLTLSPELTHHLEIANRIYNAPETQPLLLPSPSTKAPIVGSLWKRIRRSAHELVLFYVNRYVSHQISVNHHLVSVINQLVTLSQAQRDQIDMLRQELDALQTRLQDSPETQQRTTVSTWPNISEDNDHASANIK